jgi:uncharacterized protein YdhG (YjbR/CyaY superfamily)
MNGRGTPVSIDEYLAGFGPDVRDRLQEVRTIIHTAAPEATESISYAIPTFDLAGHHLIHFAGYLRHVGVYPVSEHLAATFEEELEPFRRGKGTLQFPLDEPLPADLLRRVVELRVAEVMSRGPNGDQREQGPGKTELN